MVAAAIIGAGAAAIGAGGMMVAGSEAASATTAAANLAAGVQYAAMQQQKELSAPYRALGQAAIPTLENLLGIGPGGAGAAQQTLEQTPGYQFTKQQGQQGTEAALAAAGLGGSSNLTKGLADYTSGLASNTYQSAVGNLMGATEVGQAAAAGQAANVGAGAANLGNIAMTAGTNQANIDIATMAGLTKSVGGAADAYATYRTLQGLGQPGGGGVGGGGGGSPIYTLDPSVGQNIATPIGLGTPTPTYGGG